MRVCAGGAGGTHPLRRRRRRRREAAVRTARAPSGPTRQRRMPTSAAHAATAALGPAKAVSPPHLGPRDPCLPSVPRGASAATLARPAGHKEPRPGARRGGHSALAPPALPQQKRGDHALARQPARNSKSRCSPALATQINAPRSNRIARPGLPRPTALRGAYADQRRARRDGRICDSINVRAFAQDICVSLIARSCPCPNRVGAFGPAPLAAEPPQQKRGDHLRARQARGLGRALGPCASGCSPLAAAPRLKSPPPGPLKSTPGFQIAWLAPARRALHPLC